MFCVTDHNNDLKAVLSHSHFVAQRFLLLSVYPLERFLINFCPDRKWGHISLQTTNKNLTEGLTFTHQKQGSAWSWVLISFIKWKNYLESVMCITHICTMIVGLTFGNTWAKPTYLKYTKLHINAQMNACLKHPKWRITVCSNVYKNCALLHTSTVSETTYINP